MSEEKTEMQYMGNLSHTDSMWRAYRSFLYPFWKFLIINVASLLLVAVIMFAGYQGGKFLGLIIYDNTTSDFFIYSTEIFGIIGFILASIFTFRYCFKLSVFISKPFARLDIDSTEIVTCHFDKDKIEFLSESMMTRIQWDSVKAIEKAKNGLLIAFGPFAYWIPPSSFEDVDLDQTIMTLRQYWQTHSTGTNPSSASS